MKKFRRGFTLLELLVVIGVMGILSTMAMIAGQQTTDAARANNIADGFEKAASAMMMYYADNANDIATNGDTEADIVEGANAYLKQTGALVTYENVDYGKYAVHVEGNAPDQTWWLVYTLPATDVANIGPIMKNKAERMGLKMSNNANDVANAVDYDGTRDEIYMKVR